jgi:hypothetical protein
MYDYHWRGEELFSPTSREGASVIEERVESALPYIRLCLYMTIRHNENMQLKCH